MRTRFVAAASLCLLPLLGVILYILDQSLSNSRDQLYETEVAFAEVVSRGINQTLQENQDVLTSLSANPAVLSMEQTQAGEVLAAVGETLIEDIKDDPELGKEAKRRRGNEGGSH